MINFNKKNTGEPTYRSGTRTSVRREPFFYKKGASTIIGYVLLVTFGLIMSGVAFNYLKTYVPQETIQCPESSSLFIKSVNCENDILNVTLKNNGKFSLEGFFISSTEDDLDEIATGKLYKNYINGSDDIAVLSGANYIKFDRSQYNGFKQGTDGKYSFNLTDPEIIVKLIKITPARIEIIGDGDVPTLALCSNAQLTQKVICS